MLQVSDVVGGRIAVHAMGSLQRYETRFTYGPFGRQRRERNSQGNLDFTWPISSGNELSWGANYRHRDTEILGRFPADSTNFRSDAPTREQESNPVLDYPGFYAEDKVRVWGPLYATLGGRVDYLSGPDRWTADPRAALALRVGDHQTLRIAAGRYHQPADPTQLDPIYGNPRLGPLTADHVIAGYEWKSEFGNVRVEAFHKQYTDLVTQDSVTFYANQGHGHARGVDVFVQGTYRWLSGWASYGFLDARRKELDDPEEVPASYGVRHALTLVSQCRATSSIM